MGSISKIAVVSTDNVNCRKSLQFFEVFQMLPVSASWRVFSFLLDPYVLSRTGIFPQLVSPEAVAGLRNALLIVPHGGILPPDALAAADAKGIIPVLVQPSARELAKFGAFADVHLTGEMSSQMEEWVFETSPSSPFYHPHSLPMQCLELTGQARACARVGEFPDAVLTSGGVVFSTDFFHALELFRAQPFQFIGEASKLFVFLVRRLLKAGVARRTMAAVEKEFDLRRDFHAWGVSYLLLHRLAANLGSELDDAALQQSVVKAATKTAAGNASAGRRALGASFRRMAKLRQQMAPLDIHIMDGFHGGVLYDDVGFVELDWPTFAARWLEDCLWLAENKSWPFNMQFDAGTIECLNKRYPGLFKKLAGAWDKGLIDIVDGTYSQPLTFYSWEAWSRNFEQGLGAMEEVFGRRPETYVRQEFGFTPQLPSLLNRFGYKQAVQRVAGPSTPTPAEDERRIIWQGKDGSRIDTLPSHPTRSEHAQWFMFHAIPDLITQALERGDAYLALTNDADAMRHPLLREDVIRTHHYAPVWGRFVTYNDFFRETEPPEKTVAYTFDDYGPPLLSQNPFHGNPVEALRTGHEMETTLLAAEALAAFNSIVLGQQLPDNNDRWRGLLYLQQHDIPQIARIAAGQFLQTNLVNYEGPQQTITVEQRAMKEALPADDSAKNDIELHLHEISRHVAVEGGPGRVAYMLFTPSPLSTQAIIELPHERAACSCQGAPIPSQASAAGTKIALEIAPLGYRTVAVDPAKKSGRGGRRSARRIENERLRVEMDEKTGAVSQLFRKGTKKKVLQGLGNELVVGDESEMVAESIERIESGDVVESIRSKGRIRENGKDVYLYETVASLPATDDRVDFRTTLTFLGSQERDIWDFSFDTDKIWRQTTRVRFCTAMDRPKAMRCYMNVSEETGEPRYSSQYFTALLAGESVFCMYNRGNQHYGHANGVLDNVMCRGRAHVEDFRYAIRPGSAPVNGLVESMRWQAPVFVTPVEAGGKGLPGEFSLLETAPDNILATSLRSADGSLVLRLAETCGKNTRAAVTFTKALTRVRVDGNTLVPRKGKVTFQMKAWQVQELVVG